jgi:hypothetical protein
VVAIARLTRAVPRGAAVAIVVGLFALAPEALALGASTPDAAPSAEAAPGAAPAVPAAVDDEGPKDAPPVQAPLAPPRKRAPHEYVAEPEGDPGNGVMLRFGYSGGGATLVTAQYQNGDTSTIDAGQGLILSIGGLVTPLWNEKTFGLGGGAEIGWKYEGIGASNANLSLSRFPLILSLHALVLLQGRTYLFLAAGAEKDLGIDFSPVPGVTGTWGPYGALGFYKWGHRGAVDLQAHFAAMKYSGVDAKTFGVTLGMHVNIGE